MKILNALISIKTSLALLAILALAMAAATFIENDYGTARAREWVYETWWFELIFLWLSVNFLANIPRHRLFSAGKWPVGLFHLAFIIIVFGAGVTRYTGLEGQMHIREGQTEDRFFVTAKEGEMPRVLQLPFALRLEDFELDRYPGSRSPSGYASEVVVIDGEKSFPYRIYMNRVLDYRGYRFYQASYDEDELGTVLSVSRDRPGTYLTYLGYFLLTVGMFFTFFARGSRFQTLRRRLSRSVLLLVCILAVLPARAQEGSIVPREKASEYGRLVVQDLDGRMKPLQTLAQEIARKLTGKSYVTISGEAGKIRLRAEQFLLAVQLDPERWARTPLIKADPEKSPQAFDLLGVPPSDKLSFLDFFSEQGEYLLHDAVEAANQLKPALRGEGQKELLKLDERFNIFFALLNGDFLRLFPRRGDERHTWYTSDQTAGFSEEDALFVRNISAIYLAGLEKGLVEGDWSGADEALGYMRLYQQKAGEAVIPSERHIEAELLYNRLNLAARLFGPFWLLGALMLGLSLSMLFFEKRYLRIAWRIGEVLAWLGFAAFTFHLGLRWYVAGHAPWSDGFEMLVFSAWCILLFGLLFSGKSRFTAPLGLLFSGTLLFVSFLDWLNPEITNLVPVLQSYWLKIHVAVIVAGYAPLALSAVIGLFSLVLIIGRPRNAGVRWRQVLEELAVVNELSMTIGLFLFTVGTFLGGVWANESWGRYWAWDPKETWALISILVYSFVVHLRLIPALNNLFVFSLASLWAFSSIIMTSFGVNYYLSGLHSYAQGDPLPVPGWIYTLTAVLLLVSLAALWRFYGTGHNGQKEKKDIM
jgi:cytochrome c-type biogenesis protein CcsB